MESPNMNKAPDVLNKWDKLIQEMDEIPDGIEPDKMRVLLPCLYTTSDGENIGRQTNGDAKDPDPMEKYEKLMQSEDEANINPVMALMEKSENDSKTLEDNLYTDSEKNVIENQPPTDHCENDSSFKSAYFVRESLPTEDIVHSFDKIEEDAPMLSTQPKPLGKVGSSSNWLSEVRKRKSRCDMSFNGMSIVDSYNDKSRPVSECKRAKRGKYPWEIAKQASNHCTPSFKTAGHQLMINTEKRQGKPVENSYGMQKRSLGTRRTVGNKFVPPVKLDDECGGYDSGGTTGRRLPTETNSPHASIMTDDRLKNIEARMVELIMNEILDNSHAVTWDDIAGLDTAKITIQEIVVWPMLRPDIFTGLRGPPKGILLFGPPGTGKTLIGKCIASQSESTFFSISASSLTSKWIGEGEKMVRALFAVARCHQPAVIFIDEIDSLLSQRSQSEHESSRRMKTEFLVQLDGATCVTDEKILVVGATNRPQELDEAARRRLVKRLYIPLPNLSAREHIIHSLLRGHSNSLEDADVKEICNQTDGYSGADMANLCREAALGPIRSISLSQIKHISVDEVRPISAGDFRKALNCIKASVSEDDLHMYENWNNKFGMTQNNSLNS